MDNGQWSAAPNDRDSDDERNATLQLQHRSPTLTDNHETADSGAAEVPQAQTAARVH